VAALPSTNGFMPKGIVVGPDGSLFITGATNVKPHNGVVVKLHADGTLDSSFAKGGRFDSPTPGGATVEFYSIALQADGKPVMTGYHGDATLSPLVAHLTASGA